MPLFRSKSSIIERGTDDPRLVIPVAYQLGPEGEASPTDTPSRVNIPVLIGLLVFLVLIPAVGFPLSYYQDSHLQRVALAQAKKLAEEGKVDLALVNIDHLLEQWPDTIGALELQARLLTDTVQTPDQALYAANVQDHLLRLDPMGPGRQDNRARLVELYIAFGDAVRYASNRRETATDRYESRYRAAAKIAEQRIAFGADDGEAHRLLAKALEGLSLSGDAKAISDATHEYEIALRRDPKDAISAERLAYINLERRNDPAVADQIIEALLAANPDSASARIVRYRYFLKTHRDDRARVELEAATRLEPTDLRVRINAANDALLHRDVVAARNHLDAIPQPLQKDKRVLTMRGQIELVERHPEEAVDEWRKGLALFGGNDKELTCRLAHSLILLGRFDEARPLIDHYARLSPSSSEPMTRFLNGLMKERTGRPTAAIVELESARNSIDEVTLAELEVVLGRSYEAINDQNKALIAYRRAVEASPTSANAHRALARQLSRKNLDKAAEELGSAIRLIPYDPNLVGDLAANRLTQMAVLPPAERDLGRVNVLIDRAEKQGLDPALVLKLRAESLTVAGRLDQALKLLEEASRGPLRDREEVWLVWASGLIQTGQPVQALQVLERASASDQAGDHVSFRAARARLHVQAGRAREAHKILTEDPERLPSNERAALASTRADLLHSLGDFRGAREACIEWARLARNDPQPGLKLLALAQNEGEGGEETSRIGLEFLKAVGGDEEPYSLAARGFDLLLSNRQREETRSIRLEMAEKLSQKLQKIAPDLSVSYLLRGIILERSHRVEEAIADYRIAMNGNTSSVALPRLIALFTRLKRYRDLALLKREFGASTAIDQLSAAAFLEIGDHEGASKMIAQIIESLPDNVQMRAIQARLLSETGMNQAAEQTFRSLIERNKNLPDPWLALLVFQKVRGSKEQLDRTIEQAKASYQGERPELFMARCHWIAGDQAEASRLFDEAIAKYPTDLSVLKLASEFDEAIGHPADAEKRLRNAIKLDESASWARRKLALLLSTHPDRHSWDEAWSLVAPDPSRPVDSPDDRLVRTTLLERSSSRARRLEAAPSLTALAEDLPATHPIAIEARGRLARALLDSDQPGEAAKVIEPAAMGANASNPSTLALFVEALARSGKVDQAAAKLTQLAELEPKATRTACCRAWVQLARGKKAEASATLVDAFAEVQDSAEAVESGMMCYRLLLAFGDFDAAERMARQMVSRRPQEGWLLARLQYFRGDFAGAFQTARSALEAGAGKDAIKVVMDLAIGSKVDEVTRRGAGAIAESLLAKSPNDPELVMLVGALRHSQGRFEEEGQLYLQALKVNPSHEALLNNRAWILCEFQDQPADALTMIDQVIKIAGRISSFCDTRGVVLTRLGRFDEAIVDLEEAVHDQPTPTRLFHLARAYLKAGNSEQHRKYRDLARKTLVPSMLDPRDRDDFDLVMAP